MATADMSNIIAGWPVEVRASGSVDDAYRYLTVVVGLQDDLAVHELNQKLTQGRLQLRYRRTDTAGIGQEGVVPSASWSLRLLCVAVDRNSDAERGPLDWATGKIAAANDGRAFAQLLVAQDPGQTYELVISMADVRMLWPADVQVAQPEKLKRQEPNFKRSASALPKCTEYLVKLFKASPDCRTKSNKELLEICRSKFKVTKPEYEQARRDALTRVPEAKTAWGTGGAPKRR